MEQKTVGPVIEGAKNFIVQDDTREKNGPA